MDENLEQNIDELKDKDESVGNQEQIDQPNPLEDEARASGWVPEDEYTGDKNKWIDAKEFLNRGPLFKKIDSQSRDIKALRQAIVDMQELHTKAREQEYKKALAEVRQEKKAALLEGDADAVIEADEKIDMLRDAQKEQVIKPVEESTAEAHPEFVNWVSRNAWYESNKGMKAFADTIGIDFRRQGMSPSEVLKAVEKEVRKEFPHKFENPNQKKASPVEGGTTVKAGGAKGQEYALTDQERKAMNNFIRLGVMTKEQYIESLKAI